MEKREEEVRQREYANAREESSWAPTRTPPIPMANNTRS